MLPGYLTDGLLYMMIYWGMMSRRNFLQVPTWAKRWCPHFPISGWHSWCVWRFWWGWTSGLCTSKWLWPRFTCEELYCILLVLMVFYLLIYLFFKFRIVFPSCLITMDQYPFIILSAIVFVRQWYGVHSSYSCTT